MHIHGHGTGIRFQPGLTLLEVMITLTIAAILLAAGEPSFREYTQKQRMKAAVGSLHNDLAAARGEAIHQNSRVIACPGSPAEGCLGETGWSNGWIVFSDSNGDRQRQEGETLVRHGQGFDQLRVHGPDGRSDVRFLPDGSAPGSNQSITFCGLAGPDKARRLVISNLGRIRRDDAPGLDASHCP